ncbi:MAG: hypothetical protein HKN19_12655, partial [Halioglobus sp.]|nr:hypothetical protein [Halioglobus sp.]
EMNLPRHCLPVLAVCLLAACAGAVEPSYYLLRPDVAATSRTLEPAPYRLGPVSVAPYIDRAGLLLETAPGQIRPARNHLWAEPVQEGVRALLAAQISRELGQDILPQDPTATGPIISIRIDQLHGTLTGEAKLVAYWSLIEGGATTRAEQFAGTLALASDGYRALAQAQKSLLNDLARSIANQLN